MPKGYKTGGRQKGTPNKVTSELREIIKQLINESITPEFFATLPPEKKADLVIRLLPYVLPKYADVSADTEQGNQPQIFINWIPPEQLEK